MKIKLIDFGLEKDHYPFRPHENHAGAVVYMPVSYTHLDVYKRQNYMCSSPCYITLSSNFVTNSSVENMLNNRLKL